MAYLPPKLGVLAGLLVVTNCGCFLVTDTSELTRTVVVMAKLQK